MIYAKLILGSKIKTNDNDDKVMSMSDELCIVYRLKR